MAEPTETTLPVTGPQVRVNLADHTSPKKVKVHGTHQFVLDPEKKTTLDADVEVADDGSLHLKFKDESLKGVDVKVTVDENNKPTGVTVTPPDHANADKIKKMVESGGPEFAKTAGLLGSLQKNAETILKALMEPTPENITKGVKALADIVKSPAFEKGTLTIGVPDISKATEFLAALRKELGADADKILGPANAPDKQRIKIEKVGETGPVHKAVLPTGDPPKPEVIPAVVPAEPPPKRAPVGELRT